jgi:glycosyltransferase involved in cell wall biosynthesis
MPTYNRRATILRAIDSVRAQTFGDWELIVVDDGSTDGTAELLQGLDPRLRLMRQANRGAAAARNLGLTACRGRYITFLDSDDEWLPHFLALTCGFLERNPAEAMVATESYEMKYDGRWVRQDLHALAGHYVWLARRLGSSALDLPAGSQDDYLRVYDQVENLGDWAAPLLPETERDPAGVRWYRGHLFEKYRWGYFHSLWCVVVRRETMNAIGAFPEHRSSCNDLEFLIELARRAPSNMLAVPAARKHLLKRAGAAQLSRGPAYATFTRNYAEIIHHYYVRGREHDAEARRIHAFRCLEATKAALGAGVRSQARTHIAAARRELHWPAVWLLSGCAWLTPSAGSARFAHDLYRRLEDRIPGFI